MVEEYGHQREYDRDALRDYFLDNWYRLFGPLRKSKALESAQRSIPEGTDGVEVAGPDRNASGRVRQRACRKINRLIQSRPDVRRGFDELDQRMTRRSSGYFLNVMRCGPGISASPNSS